MQTLLTKNFTAGRCDSSAPAVIVLHEFDGAIEQLDNIHYQTLSLTSTPPPMDIQHRSFHYGISDCTIHQYVKDADTAWSLGTSDGAGLLPTPPFVAGQRANCKTINIAVATGVLVTPSAICDSPFNNYSDATKKCLAKLIADVAAANGIPLDAAHVVKHAPELNDLDVAAIIANAILFSVTPAPLIDLELCESFQTLPSGGNVTAATKLVGQDCKTYLLPAISIPPFRAVMNLSAGPNTITHNMGLVSPFASVVQLRDDATGTEISGRVLNETANSLVVDVNSALSGVRVTIVV